MRFKAICFGAALVLLLAGCNLQQCIRHSDCPAAMQCSALGYCELPAVDGGDGDGGDGGSNDGAVDAATDDLPPTLDDAGTVMMRYRQPRPPWASELTADLAGTSPPDQSLPPPDLMSDAALPTLQTLQKGGDYVDAGLD